MNNVYIIGSGVTPVAEHFEQTLTALALQALRGALGAIEPARVGALYVGNALGGPLAGQMQLGAAIAGAAGMHGAEALVVEAAGASGGAALRQGYMAIASGAYDLVALHSRWRPMAISRPPTV
jgi:acetyl-CoA C-acetyltransferase